MKEQKTIFLLPFILVVALVAGCATSLEKAVVRGDVESVSKLLDQGTPVNSAGGGIAPIYIAAREGQVEIIRLLLDKGADVNRKVSAIGCINGYTPLHFAVDSGHIEAVRLLLQRGANPGIRSDGFQNMRTVNNDQCADYSPLEIAKQHNYTAIAQLLKEAEAAGHVGIAEESPKEEARLKTLKVKAAERNPKEEILIKTNSVSDEIFNKLKRLKEFQDEGIITHEEFEKKKKELLDRL